MKQLIFILFISISSTIIVAQTETIENSQKQETPVASTFKSAWFEKWDNSKDYLIGIAEAMPEEFYNFKPTKRQMTFKEQLLHIKGNMDWLSNTYFSKADLKQDSSELPMTKAETITLIKNAFEGAYKLVEAAPRESFSETVEFFAGPKSKIQILNLLQDHVTHHRGQLIVYLNLKNIEPPGFIGW